MKNQENLLKIIEIAKLKLEIDKKENWSKGSSTYLEEIKKELIEVEDELKLGKQIYIEDELGDVLWDYLNLLINLESENKIKVENVFERSRKKYFERINGINNGISWNEIKTKQKLELFEQQQKFNF